MAVTVLVSASGSPGVTTTAVGMALAWPSRAVLVDADPRGGQPILAGYFGGQLGTGDAMTTLALSLRDGSLRQVLPQVLTSFPRSQAALLPGPRSHAQAKGLSGLWQPLAAELRGLDGLGTDVIIDAGRLGMTGFPEPLLAAADVVLVVVRSDLVSLAGVRQWAEGLRDAESAGGPSARLLVVGEGRPYSAAELSRALGLAAVDGLPWDPDAAATFSSGRQHRHLDRSALVRGLRVLASTVAGLARGRVASTDRVAAS